MLFLIRRTKQRNKARKNSKKHGRTKKQESRKEKKNKKEIEGERETESEKGEVKEAKEKRETLRNEQNNPFQGKNSVFVKKNKKHKILRRVEGQLPPKHVQFFLFLSLWSPHGHLSSSYTLFIAKMSLILFSFVFVFSFSLLGGCVSVCCFHLCLYSALCF